MRIDGRIKSPYRLHIVRIVNAKRIFYGAGTGIDPLEPVALEKLNGSPQPLRLERMLRSEIIAENGRTIEEVRNHSPQDGIPWKMHSGWSSIVLRKAALITRASSAVIFSAKISQTTF